LSHHLFTGKPEVRDSHVHLSDRPGFGIEVNWEFAKKYRA
jgi:L-alanine-DL-glutamate epimerase-like enolase superfamily enzyme